MSNCERRIDFVQKNIGCMLGIQSEQSTDPALLTIKPETELNFAPDGMSGGAAFVAQNVNGEPCIYLAGMIVRAGKNDVHILKIGYILQFLDVWLSHNST